MTTELFREHGYLKKCDASVISVAANGICVDRTVFYPEGGGKQNRRITIEFAGPAQ